LNHTSERIRFFKWLQTSAEVGAAKGRLVVKSNGRLLLVNAASMRWIRAEGDYVRLHTWKQSYFVRETMSSLEERIDARKFIRIHRSVIVNLEFVAGFKPLPGGDYRVFLQDGAELVLSRTFRKQITRFPRSLP